MIGRVIFIARVTSSLAKLNQAVAASREPGLVGLRNASIEVGYHLGWSPSLTAQTIVDMAGLTEEDFEHTDDWPEGWRMIVAQIVAGVEQGVMEMGHG